MEKSNGQINICIAHIDSHSAIAREARNELVGLLGKLVSVTYIEPEQIIVAHGVGKHRVALVNTIEGILADKKNSMAIVSTNVWEWLRDKDPKIAPQLHRIRHRLTKLDIISHVTERFRNKKQ
jgi:hypothetical protein